MNKIKSTLIGIDSCHNDPVDIRCGGCYYLGFDFYVKEEEKDKIHDFIVKTLEELQVPLIKITMSYNYMVNENEIWNEDRIYDVIVRESTYLKEQGKRNYTKIK